MQSDDLFDTKSGLNLQDCKQKSPLNISGTDMKLNMSVDIAPQHDRDSTALHSRSVLDNRNGGGAQ